MVSGLAEATVAPAIRTIATRAKKQRRALEFMV
jgi:hypothetical protein